MTENTLRWSHAWQFLSLDCIVPFYDELWLPFEDTSFQTKLRIILEPLIREESVDISRIDMPVKLWIARHCERSAQQMLSDWIKQIYVYEGPDRLEETIWRSLSIVIAKLQPENENEVRYISLMNALTEAQSPAKQKLQVKLDSLLAEKPSEWDLMAMNVAAMEKEDVATSVELISNYNLFVTTWKDIVGELGVDELKHLHKIGIRAAPIAHLEGFSIPTPGFWECENAALRRPRIR